MRQVSQWCFGVFVFLMMVVGSVEGRIKLVTLPERAATVVRLDNPRATLIEEERANLYVIGYVDYMDRFEGRHRAGYARRYDPWAGERNMIYRNQDGLVERVPDPTGARNNLPFVTEMAYNDDRLSANVVQLFKSKLQLSGQGIALFSQLGEVGVGNNGFSMLLPDRILDAVADIRRPQKHRLDNRK